jgi:hypothetical protein
MCNMNTGPTGSTGVKTPQELDREDEEKVFATIQANNGKLNLEALERISGIPWKGGRLSNALYGLDQVQRRIKQSSRDLFTCTFSTV